MRKDPVRLEPKKEVHLNYWALGVAIILFALGMAIIGVHFAHYPANFGWA